MQGNNKEMAKSFLQLVVAGQIHEAFAKCVAGDMRHHNVTCAGDGSSLEKAMQENHDKFPHKVIDIKRILEDGDTVAVHSHLKLGTAEGGFAVVHILRFANDRIVEMWDIAQPVPDKSPNENSMF